MYCHAELGHDSTAQNKVNHIGTTIIQIFGTKSTNKRMNG